MPASLSMELGKTFYARNREEWRAWLAKHHATAKEIWLVYYRKDSGKPRIPYNDAVEEALCFGWIDSILKKVDAERFAQRFTPRRPTSKLSPMNRERIRRLIAAGRMTRAGLDKVAHLLGGPRERKGGRAAPVRIPPDILEALKADPLVWKHFQKLPASYRRIRIGWIDLSRARPAEFAKRLRYFLKMTRQNKRYGMVQ